MPGSTLGSYRVERLLGRGGMGAVFLAYDTTLRRQVALKLVEGADDAAATRARLLREARSAAALNHPNICTIHEVGAAGGRAFIAMEYVAGRSLRDRLDAGALPLEDVKRYGLQAADALAYAHERGVVHRDFKAANIILGDAGRLKVVDFGLAHRHDTMTATATTAASHEAPGAAAGTPYAMAPEQVRGEGSDARTDIWAFGVLLYEMLAGAKPFSAPTLPELFSSILRDAPAPMPDSVPAAMQGIVERCLAREPGGRYQSAAEIRAALETAGSGAPGTVVRPRVPARRRVFAAAALAAGAVIVLAVAGGVRGWWRALLPDPPAIRLAVLPFRNLTNDPSQDVFSDGLTEETITALGRLRSERLSVISSRSSSRYRSRDVPLAQVGRELDVDYILDGSALREGQDIRVNAALINARDESQKWTDSFKHEMSGLLALQSDIARGVADALAVALVPEEQTRLSPARPVDPAAYAAYLQGVGHASRLTREDFDRAQSYFEMAAARDPRFALPYVGLAGVWAGRQQMHFSTPEEAAPRLRAAVDRARALDPDLPEVRFRLAGRYTWTDWNWAAAEPEFRRAIELRPDYAEARAFYAHYLLIMGRKREAVEQIERALRSDPFNDLIQSLCGIVLTSVGRHDEAMAQFRSALKTASRSPVALNGLARALYQSGKLEESFTAEKAVWMTRGDTETVAALERGWRDGGYRSAVRAAADVQAARAQGAGKAPLHIAILYMRAGDHDRALTWAERSFAAHDPNIPYLATATHWDAVRTDPRFRALIKRLNLPE